ncbi:hypothetical protein [Streptomyces sp. NPDC054842]
MSPNAGARERGGELPPQRAGTSGSRSVAERPEDASTVRLTVMATVGTLFTAVFLGWLWGTIAPQPPILATFVQDSVGVTHSLVERQAQHLSRGN